MLFVTTYRMNLSEFSDAGGYRSAPSGKLDGRAVTLEYLILLIVKRGRIACEIGV